MQLRLCLHISVVFVLLYGVIVHLRITKLVIKVTIIKVHIIIVLNSLGNRGEKRIET